MERAVRIGSLLDLCQPQLIKVIVQHKKRADQKQWSARFIWYMMEACHRLSDSQSLQLLFSQLLLQTPAGYGF
jgi:hypothetical protein